MHYLPLPPSPPHTLSMQFEARSSPFAHDSDSAATMQGQPRLFRQLLEAAIVQAVLVTGPEIAAKGRAIDAVVQVLIQRSSKGALRLAGQAVTVDRCAVAGSVGKAVFVQGQFDVDLVAFLNLPRSAGADVNLYDPDQTQASWWMRELMGQLCRLVAQGLPDSGPGLHLVTAPRVGRAAVTFTLSVPVPETEKRVNLEVDVLLAPNMATGAGAAAAAAAGCSAAGRSSSSSRSLIPADIQYKAVLTPVLALADSTLAGSSAAAGTPPRGLKVQPSYACSIWVSEASTQFVQQAAVAGAAQKGLLSGRVVTSTIRLVKAWLRNGLGRGQPGYKRLKGFMIELLVLHAAERFVSKQQQQQRSRLAGGSSNLSEFGGRYVLDLMLEVLDAAVAWAAEADAHGPSSTEEPVLFTAMAGNKYYSRQQAVALQSLAKQGFWPSSGTAGLFAVRPVVIHPVDPLSTVFGQQPAHRFTLWRQLGEEASLLAWQLRHSTWGEIMLESSLRGVLGDACMLEESD